MVRFSHVYGMMCAVCFIVFLKSCVYCQALAEGLKENSTLTTLILVDNKIGDEGAKAWCLVRMGSWGEMEWRNCKKHSRVKVTLIRERGKAIPFTKSTSHKHCVSSSFFFSWAAATANWLRARLVPVSATLQGELQHSSWTSNHCDAPTFLQIMAEREWNYANRNEDSLKSKQSKNIKLSGPAMTVLLMATFEASN